MQDENYMPEKAGEEKEIDLMELAMKLWSQRKRIVKWCACGAVLGLVVAFSIPKEYTSSVKLAPEVTDGKAGGGGLSALASMAGFSTGSSSADAVYPQLYPDVVGSIPFLTGLFDVKVETKKDHDVFTVQQYLEKETRSPWWSVILSLPGKLLGLLRSSDSVDENHKLDNFQLTTDESRLVEKLSNLVTASVDQKTSVVTIAVTMQDPLVSAILADTVVARLQEYVTDYRTNKARNDLQYAELLNDEARANYYEAQQRYAGYLDHNQGIALRSAQTEQERLENEASLAFSLYNQTAQQVQKARAKVQETTPVYAIISPATVPLKPVKPRKVMILIGFVFLAFVASSAWILFGEPLMEEYKEKAKQMNTKPEEEK
ncbi:MAG: chain-length determining protein [Muribaculaceae bacterium]|nr:chain-length determining protein [Muribaculaceae bacterium]